MSCTIIMEYYSYITITECREASSEVIRLGCSNYNIQNINLQTRDASL